MTSVRDILARKGSTVVTVRPDASVLEASRLMSERSIGAVVVVEAGKVVGIFTERDVMRRIVAEQRDAARVQVREVMTTTVATATPQTTVEECAAQMTARRLRHLPVMASDGLCGIVTIGDLTAQRVAEQAETITQLKNYLYEPR